jgi:MFS family permease
MFTFSSRSATLAARIGPRIQMSVGPVLCAVGALLLAGVNSNTSYWVDVLPGMLVFAVGLVCLVAPLTATVLAAAPNRWAGIASGINNAVARIGALIAVAAIPVVVGLSGDDYDNPAAMTDGYHEAILICAAVLVLGGIVGWLGLRGTAAASGSQSGEREGTAA